MTNPPKKSSWRVLLYGFTLALAGCATIVSGTKQTVQITSSPASADIKIERAVSAAMETVYEGSTPTDVKLKRKHSYLLTLSLDGYRPVEMGLDSGSNGWVWGNLVFGGIIGLIVDFSNGAAKKLEPDAVHVELVSVGTAALDERPTRYAVFQIKNSDGSLRTSPVPLIPDPNYMRPLDEQ